VFIHVVDTLRAIEAHVSGGNKDAGLKIFKTYVSMDKRLGSPKKKDDSLLAPPSKVANRPRGSNRGSTSREMTLNRKKSFCRFCQVAAFVFAILLHSIPTDSVHGKLSCPFCIILYYR
jgi:hypothetical protein